MPRDRDNFGDSASPHDMRYVLYLDDVEATIQKELVAVSAKRVRRRALLTAALSSIGRVRDALARFPEAVDLAFAVDELKTHIFADDVFSAMTVSRGRSTGLARANARRSRSAIKRAKRAQRAAAKLSPESSDSEKAKFIRRQKKLKLKSLSDATVRRYLKK